MMETAERLAHFVRAEKRRSALYEFIVDLSGVAESGSPLRYPLVCGGELRTWSFLLASVV